MPPKRIVSYREKLLNTEYDVDLGDDIDDTTPDRTQFVLLNLTDNAISYLFDFATLGVKTIQLENWIDAENSHTPPPDPNQAPIDARLVLSEIQEMRIAQNFVVIDVVATTTANCALIFPLNNIPDPYPDETTPCLTDWLATHNATDYPRKRYSGIIIFINTTDFQGPQGEPGADGATGADGAMGADGATGPAGPGGAGTSPTDGGGSGTKGAPADGDIKVYTPNGCDDAIIDFPYCSASFTFDDADLYPAIVDFATTTGRFNPAAEQLISADLKISGAAYAGVTVTIDVTLSEEESYTGSGGAESSILSITNDDEVKIVPHTVETFGVPEVLEVKGYHYDGFVGVNFVGTPSALLNGTMSTYPLIGGANCSVPPTADDPAWLQICVVGFVKHPLECTAFLPTSFDFDDGQQCWGEASWLFDGANDRHFFGGFFSIGSLNYSRQHLFAYELAPASSYTLSGEITIGSNQTTFDVEILNFTDNYSLDTQTITHTPSSPTPLTYAYSLTIDGAHWSPEKELQFRVHRANTYAVTMNLA